MKKLIDALATAGASRPWPVIAVIALITIAAVIGALRVEMEFSQRSLLPEGYESVETITEVEEDYVLLRGNVIIEFIDEEADVLHRIKAREILINRTQNMLNASGDVEYLLQRGDEKPEIFQSDRFSFDLENWAGVFVEGRGETERKIEDREAVRFFFRGSTITRRADDVVLLESGTVTSCDAAEAPHWRIAASRIYVLAPGECMDFQQSVKMLK